MKRIGNHISKNCTKTCFVYIDQNGHYHWEQYELIMGKLTLIPFGKTKFKHIESCNRAIQKWLKAV